MNTDVSIILDTRRKKKNETFPVKLRVYSPLLQKARMYSAGLEMTKREFESVWETLKTRKENKESRDFLEAIKTRATEAAKKADPFSFEVFEKKLLRRKGDGKNVIYHYQKQIAELKGLGRYGSAESYESSLKSIKEYISNETGISTKQTGTKKEITKIPFNKITPLFLKKYENYMVQKAKSKTTIGIYLRALRAVFNVAIKENEVSEDIYPFGKGKYKIPKGKAVKKALSKPQLKVLLNAEAQTPEQEKAKDFWLFSFICNGMNIKDIALLKYKNIQDNRIKFERAKTEHTVDEQTIVQVHLTELAKSIIEKYGNKNTSPEQFVFPILDKRMNKESMQRKIKLFTRYVNQHIKKIAKANDLPDEISTYWARHSFATLSIQGGANMEFVKEAFGHQNITTTQNYFAGFEDETKKQIVESLLNFD